jgi:hypothetical protein
MRITEDFLLELLELESPRVVVAETMKRQWNFIGATDL